MAKSDRIICIGSAGKDIFLPTAEAVIIDTPEDTYSQQKLCFELGGKHHIEDRFESPGGCATNVSVGVARLGVAVSIYSCVGYDSDGEWIIAELTKNSISCEKIIQLADMRTDLSAIIVDKNTGERTIFANRDVGEHLEICEDDIKDHQWLFVGSLYGEYHTHTKRIKNILEDQDLSFIFNPGQHNIKENVEEVLSLIGYTTLLFVNKDEAIEIVANAKPMYNENELSNEDKLLDALRECGAQIVVLTDGKRGAWTADDAEHYHIEPHDGGGSALDTTGAGDAFSSGFIAAYLYEQSLQECLSWGSINATGVVGYYGAHKGLLQKESMLKKCDEE